MSHSEPTENDAESEGQAPVSEPEVVPRAKRRQLEQINCPSCRRADVSGERHHLEDGGAHLVRRRMLPPQDRRFEHEAGREGELGFCGSV